ncbi:NACHT domain-containing protein [Listeria booriae]|uniref:NACHT domain-containing protein n=1 Tax=Listeria booriae TaxID=1552123 RepID=A0A7X0Z861_9LIST|nr:NACHT domain-containing protein [Listeria booriae]MBC2177740.1 NACHT domain-containing protein [Listeria booriae]MBC2177839.1 NACHT domain-containing protein [Listeria booriae]
MSNPSNEIFVKVMTDVTVGIVKNAISSISSKVSDFNKKKATKLSSSYVKYLKTSFNKYCKIKTILYKREPQDLYSFYESLDVKRDTDDQIISSENIMDIVSIGNKLIITGTGGSGKTVMLKYLFLESIKKNFKIPILIELRSLNDTPKEDINLLDYIYNSLESMNLSIERKYFEYSLVDGNYLILLDGFDELNSDIAKKVTEEIINISDKYHDNHFIVSSRPSYDFVAWNDYIELSTQALTKEKALSLIDKLDFNTAIKKKFYKELESELFFKYHSFASVPLLLTIMLLTYENNASIPDKLNDFYEQAFAALYHTHDALKGGYSREIRSNLGYDIFKDVFSYFCFKTYFNQEYEFTRDKLLSYIEEAVTKRTKGNQVKSSDYLLDLTKSVCMLIQDGLIYKFSHRSFQEYFAAVYTTQLNDTTQARLLKSWLKEDGGLVRAHSGYLNILRELQEERYEKNIIYPAMLELKKQLERCSDEGERLATIVSGFRIRALSRVDEDNQMIRKYRFSIEYKNIYFYNIINEISRTNINWSIRAGGSYLDRENKMAEKLFKHGFIVGEVFTIKEAREVGILDDVLDMLRYTIKRLNRAEEWMNEYNPNPIKNKSNFMSMLNDL